MATLCSAPGGSEGMRNALCTSLVLLGIDRMHMEHTLRTPVNEKMFMHMNKQAGEYVLHFLLTCIDGERSLTSFKYIWPLLEKKQEAQFLKIAFEWYKEIHTRLKLKPPVVARACVTPGNPKFYGTLLVLIPVALRSQIKTCAPDQVVLCDQGSCTKTEEAVLVKLLRVWKLHHHQHYCQQQMSRAHSLQVLRAKAIELKSNYHKLQQKKKQMIEEIKKTYSDPEVLKPIDRLLQDFQSSFKEKSEEVLEVWKKTEKFTSIEENLWENVAQLFDRNWDSPTLTSVNVQHNVPKTLAKEHAHTILQKGLGSLFVNNNLDLLTLSGYSALAMTSMLQCVKKSHASAKPVCSQALEGQQNRVHSLSTNMLDMEIHLRDLLANLLQSVADQRATLMKSLVTSSNSSSQLDVGQGVSQICPPTPPIRLVATPGSVAKVHVQPPLSLLNDVRDRKDVMSWRTRLHNSSNVDTAVQKLSKSHRMSLPTSEENSKLVAGDLDQDGLNLEYLTLDSRGRYRTVVESSDQDRLGNSLQSRTKGKQERKPHMKSAIPVLSVTPSFQTETVSDKEKQTTEHHSIVEVNSSRSEMTSHKIEEADTVKENGAGEQCDFLLDKLAKQMVEGDSTLLNNMSVNVCLNNSLATPSRDKFSEYLIDTTLCAEGDSKDENLKFTDSGLDTNTPESLLEVIEKINVTPKQSPWTIKKRRMLSSLPSASRRKSLVYARSQSPPLQDNVKTLDLEMSYGTPKVVNVTPVRQIGKGVLGSTDQGFKVTQSNFNTLIEEYKQWKSECPEDLAKKSTTRFKNYVKNLKDSNVKEPRQALDYTSIEYKMQSLETLLTDIELPKSSVETIVQSTGDDEDEKFLDSGLVDKYLSQPLSRSSLLPADSLFNTLTDSILMGETDDSILLLEDVQEEVKRESILMKRQSLAENGWISMSSNGRLSDMFSTLRLSGIGTDQGLLETSDSCLLSTSFDDM